MTTRLTRRFARHYLAVPLRGRITPNGITTLRLISGIVACLLFAQGTYGYAVIGGIVWTIGCFLDRIDGELARLWQMTSRLGHVYDYLSDAVATVFFFIAIGYGSPHPPLLTQNYLPIWPFIDPFAMGIIAGIAVAAAFALSQAINALLPANKKAWQGDGFMDLDDIPYFFAIVAWVDALDVLLLAACLGAPLFTCFATLRWLNLRLRKKTHE